MKNILSVNWWIESSGEYECRISAPFRHQAVRNNGFIFCYNLLCHCERWMLGGFCLSNFSHTSATPSLALNTQGLPRSHSQGHFHLPLNTFRHLKDLSKFVWILNCYFQCPLLVFTSHLRFTQLIWANLSCPACVVMTAAVQWSPEIPRGCPHIMNIKLGK